MTSDSEQLTLPRCLLVLTDSPSNGLLYEDFFSYKGCLVDCIDSQALQGKRISKSYEFVLVDMELPADELTELLKRTAAALPDLPLLVVNTDADFRCIEQCFRVGVNDYVVKPVNLELLSFKVSQLYGAEQLIKDARHQQHALRHLVYQHQFNQEIAHNVYENMLARFSTPLPYCDVVKVAADEFCGDIFLTGKAPNGNVYLLLADATGHGLAAAIQILPLANIFHAMVAKGCELSLMAVELNQRLHDSGLGDRFVACCLVELSQNARELRVWNGGMPDVLLFDEPGKIVHRFSSQHMALGVLDRKLFSVATERMPIDAGTRLVMFSDGVTEQRNQHGDWFGEQRLLNLLAETGSSLEQRLIGALNEFLGNTDYKDDITVAETDLTQLHKSVENTEHYKQIPQGCVESKIRVSGRMLGEAGLLNTFSQLLKNIYLPEEVRHRAYTVFTELYNNALDHGILRLPSELKDDFDGFVDYLEQRDKRKQALSENDWIEITILVNSARQLLRLSIKDDGDGYSSEGDGNESEAFGRGLMLVKQLCHAVEVTPPGNETTVTVKWEDNE
ncbi:hypothetical protein HMF8227_01635 [Saliniradius amylolyticus]|uniref:Response regulatory domain-containing protein n=1 Tax=Saliniradius amylolyticus TaxID=2183582 RepID=A0A2S2E385_9ALTE|nr:fused response regulator/phosphatase [Saliniradius amylolyticus]AWL12108.1 hypothetical protein HMF8227_01635 [Saliniradius amylolyticus]